MKKFGLDQTLQTTPNYFIECWMSKADFPISSSSSSSSLFFS